MQDRKKGGKMEMLKLSRLKLQLRALISEVRDLRERERCCSEQLHVSIQKQKKTEEECGRRVKEVEAEVASSGELRRKLERKVNYLQNDNALLESKQKELNDTIQTLLQSKEHFVNAYQESTYELKRSNDTRDRKLKILSDKLKSHILLFDSIEKEALSVKQVVDNVHNVLSEKEEVVSGLKRKFDRVSEVEQVFIEKISQMETRLGTYKHELERKDMVISELETKLEAEKNSNKNQSQLQNLQKALLNKEAIIQNLISEKQALDSENKSLGAVLERIQHAFKDMNEDKVAFQLVASKERCTTPGIEDPQVDAVKDSDSLPGLGGSAVRIAYSQHDQCNTQPLVEMPGKIDQEFLTEQVQPACSKTHSACSGPESTINSESMFVIGAKSNCTVTTCQLESESSTTQADTSEHPGNQDA